LIYFLLDVGYQRIKIGTTEKGSERPNRQVVSGAGNLVVLAEVEGGRDEEKRLHEMFSGLLVEGKKEWFVAASPLWDYLSGIGVQKPNDDFRLRDAASWQALACNLAHRLKESERLRGADSLYFRSQVRTLRRKAA
jgi:hypothetical protein